ncbi:hypothetical protein JZ751_026480 [Albula glossodonta]|uniref:Uncharacterized protein n=1 Tax=Albula glossodonta TaxID=121402 RepID=A0A8T2PLP3_9TELE|nr:hypothetical protein JZ751_026480 [Albula glossodonta]
MDHSHPPEHKLPSIVEAESEPEEYFHLSPASKSRRNLTLPSLSSPVRRTSLGHLLGDELRQFNALRRCRSPIRGCRGQSPSPQHQRNEEPQRSPALPHALPPSSSTEAGACRKPSKLLIPSLNCFGPPDLSPRVVDGIEDNSHTFHFNMERSGAKGSGVGQGEDGHQVNATLLLETEEVRQSIGQLNKEMSHLHQEVSQLGKELHHMMHFLQAHVTVQHYTSSLSTYPYGVHVVSNPNASSSMAYNVAAGLHLHHEPMNLESLGHPAGGTWGYSGSSHSGSSQPRATVMASGYPHLHISTNPLLHSANPRQSDPAVASGSLHILDSRSLLDLHHLPGSSRSGPAPLPRQSSVTSQDSGPCRLDACDSDHPLGDSAGMEHISLECLLGGSGSLDRRDSETPESRRSSIGIQTLDTEPFWSVDMTE